MPWANSVIARLHPRPKLAVRSRVKPRERPKAYRCIHEEIGGAAPRMTFLLIVLALIVVAALLLAVELLRPEPVSEQGLAELNQSLAGGRDYERMTLLFKEDISANRGPQMREHLRQLRGDYLTAWTVCRLLGPISRERDTTIKLFLRWWGFHWLFASVWLKTYGGHSIQTACEVERLLAMSGGLRGRATALMQLDAGFATSGSQA